MENKRPTLNDPVEFALIRSIYFKDRPLNEAVDLIECNDRMEAKHKHNQKSSR